MESIFNLCVINNPKYQFKLEDYATKLLDKKIKYFLLTKPFNNIKDDCILSILVDMKQIDLDRARYIMESKPDMIATQMKLLFDVAIEDKNVNMWGAFYTALLISNQRKFIEELSKDHGDFDIIKIFDELHKTFNMKCINTQPKYFNRGSLFIVER